MAIYDNKPSMFEANGDGSYTYRWGIKEVEVADGNGSEETTKKWECEEVIVWGTVTIDKLTEAVIGKVCPIGREQKLINEFNAANLGVYGAKSSAEAQEKITAYKDFLTERNALKAQVDADCATLKIK